MAHRGAGHRKCRYASGIRHAYDIAVARLETIQLWLTHNISRDRCSSPGRCTRRRRDGCEGQRPDLDSVRVKAVICWVAILPADKSLLYGLQSLSEFRLQSCSTQVIVEEFGQSVCDCYLNHPLSKN